MNCLIWILAGIGALFLVGLIVLFTTYWFVIGGEATLDYPPPEPGGRPEE